MLLLVPVLKGIAIGIYLLEARELEQGRAVKGLPVLVITLQINESEVIK